MRRATSQASCRVALLSTKSTASAKSNCAPTRRDSSIKCICRNWRKRSNLRQSSQVLLLWCRQQSQKRTSIRSLCRRFRTRCLLRGLESRGFRCLGNSRKRKLDPLKRIHQVQFHRSKKMKKSQSFCKNYNN